MFGKIANDNRHLLHISLEFGWNRHGRFPEDPLTPLTSGGHHVRLAGARAGTVP